jgi:hypothetical protein
MAHLSPQQKSAAVKKRVMLDSPCCSKGPPSSSGFGLISGCGDDSDTAKLRPPTPTLMLELTFTKTEMTAAAAAVEHHLVIICKGGGGGVRLTRISTMADDNTTRGGGARNNLRIVLTGRTMTTMRKSPQLPQSCWRSRRGI